MADNFYSKYSPNSGSSGGVSSLNGQSGALALVAGSNITITPGSGTLTIASTGSGGLTSINSDPTAAQTLSVGTAGTDFAIVDAGGGSHVFNLPTASASNRGVVSTSAQTLAGAKTFSTSILSPIISSTAVSPATSGVIRLGNDEKIVWRNFTNSADYTLTLNTANTLETTASLNVIGQLTAANLSGTNQGDISLTAVGSSPSANGATLSVQALTLQPADGTHPGLVTALTQTIGGAKTFSALATLSLGADFSSHKAINVLDPTNPQDAATKNYVDTAVSGTSSFHVNEFTLTPTDISNGFVTLSQAPTTAVNTLLTVIGGPMQQYTLDFVVSGSQLSWSGLFLDGVLVSGDVLIVEFN